MLSNPLSAGSGGKKSGAMTSTYRRSERVRLYSRRLSRCRPSPTTGRDAGSVGAVAGGSLGLPSVGFARVSTSGGAESSASQPPRKKAATRSPRWLCACGGDWGFGAVMNGPREGRADLLAGWLVLICGSASADPLKLVRSGRNTASEPARQRGDGGSEEAEIIGLCAASGPHSHDPRGCPLSGLKRIKPFGAASSTNQTVRETAR